MAGKYSLIHEDVDVSLLLDTDWMSEYLSDRSELQDDDQKQEYRARKLAMAGYSLQAKDVDIWERVRPGFRSEEVSSN